MKSFLPNYVILLIIGLFVFACISKDSYFNVPLERYPVYNVGDTLIYRSGNMFDTFRCSSKTITDHETDKKRHEQDIDYILSNKKYTKPNQLSPFRIHLHPYEIGLSWLHFYINFQYSIKPNLPYYIVNNILYSNVYELNNNSTDTSNYKISKMYFNYQYWVIRYIKADSTVWDLYSIK